MILKFFFSFFLFAESSGLLIRSETANYTKVKSGDSWNFECTVEGGGSGYVFLIVKGNLIEKEYPKIDASQLLVIFFKICFYK